MKKVWKYLILGASTITPICATVSCYTNHENYKGEVNNNLSKIKGIDELIWDKPNKDFNLNGLNAAAIKLLKNNTNSPAAKKYIKSLNDIVKVINRHPKTYIKNIISEENEDIIKDSWVAISMVNSYIKYLNSNECKLEYLGNISSDDNSNSRYAPTWSEMKLGSIDLYSEIGQAKYFDSLFKPVGQEKNINLVQDVIDKKDKINWDEYAKQHKELNRNNHKYAMDILDGVDLSALSKHCKLFPAKLMSLWNVEDLSMRDNVGGYNGDEKPQGLNSVWDTKIEYMTKKFDPEFYAPLSYVTKDGKRIDAITDYKIQEVEFSRGNNLLELLKIKDIPTPIIQGLENIKNSILVPDNIDYLYGHIKYNNFDSDITKIKNADFNKKVKFYKITIPVHVTQGSLVPRAYKLYHQYNKVFINYQPSKRAINNEIEWYDSFESYSYYFKKTYEMQFDRFANDRFIYPSEYADKLFKEMKSDKLTREIEYQASDKVLNSFEFIIPLLENEPEPEVIFNAMDSQMRFELQYGYSYKMEEDWSRRNIPGPYEFSFPLANTYGDIDKQTSNFAILHNTTIPEIAALLKEKGL
ncbi:hypothetical protein ACNQ17_02675 [Mycoplasma sp. Sp48II]|uniref:hypothetical protein n=1 Tax=Mycoplasma sp. Sp48II TaxID=3401682 RepID=UPI003AAAFF8C